jgi:hypothetical protein
MARKVVEVEVDAGVEALRPQDLGDGEERRTGWAYDGREGGDRHVCLLPVGLMLSCAAPLAPASAALGTSSSPAAVVRGRLLALHRPFN